MKVIARTLALVAALVFGSSLALAQFADQATYVATPGGTANAITLSVANWSRNIAGVPIRFLPAAQNTSATTIVVNGVGSPIALKKAVGTGLNDLAGGELVPTEVAEIIFDGTQWQLVSNQTIVQPPGGYLTPCQVSSPSPISGCTVGQYFPTADVNSATTLYYEPVAGNIVPIFNGNRFVPRSVTESQMTLILSNSANLADHIYDVCVYDNGGVPAIGTMPGWQNFALGSGARGTAADISLVQGLWVNSVDANVTNNNVPTLVPAHKCTIVGTILVDSVNGQVSLTRAFGGPRRWATYNFYNQVDLKIKFGLTGGTWTYISPTWRPINGNSAASATIVKGLPAFLEAKYYQVWDSGAVGGVFRSNAFAIGWNVTNAPSGNVGTATVLSSSSSEPTRVGATAVATYIPDTQIGAHKATLIESNAASGGSLTMMGTEANCLGTIEWKG